MSSTSKMSRAVRNWLAGIPAITWECDARNRLISLDDSNFRKHPRWRSPKIGDTLDSWLGDKWFATHWLAATTAVRRSGFAPLRFRVGDIRFHGWIASSASRRGELASIRCVAIQRLWSYDIESDSDIDATSLEVNIPPTVWRRIGHATADLVLILDEAGDVVTLHDDGEEDLYRQCAGTSVYDIIAPEYHEEIRQAVELVKRTGVAASVRFETTRRDGRSERYDGRICSLSQIDGEPCLVLAAANSKKISRQFSTLSREERALRQLLEIHDRERRLVANEIHDGLLQDVVGAQLVLQAAMENPRDEEQVKDQLAQVRALLDEVLREGRRMISELRPMVIDETGLVNTVEYLKHEFARRFPEVTIVTDINVSFRRLEPILEGTLFRVIKEATWNAIIHGQATEVCIRMLQIGSRFLLLEVRDNGCGFELSKVDPQRYGLMGIRDRAKAFRGGCSLETAPAQGTRLTVRIPLTDGDFSRELY